MVVVDMDWKPLGPLDFLPSMADYGGRPDVNRLTATSRMLRLTSLLLVVN